MVSLTNHTQRIGSHRNGASYSGVEPKLLFASEWTGGLGPSLYRVVGGTASNEM